MQWAGDRHQVSGGVEAASVERCALVRASVGDDEDFLTAPQHEEIRLVVERCFDGFPVGEVGQLADRRPRVLHDGRCYALHAVSATRREPKQYVAPRRDDEQRVPDPAYHLNPLVELGLDF